MNHLVKYLLIFLCISGSVFASAKKQPWVQRLEPTFWWTDMKNPELQLSVYGNEISSAEFTVSYPGVTIARKELTDNPNYVFLYLKIEKGTIPGKFSIELKKGKLKQKLVYELKSRRPESANRESFTTADAIYLIMPGQGGMSTYSAPWSFFRGNFY